mmetsp:Transcript_25649/g.36178  ORF Transcript_25649/g.36178 Transcript_25649/m.36178 type:complete len:98 (+) Transcript_25649:753-1046(+)
MNSNQPIEVMNVRIVFKIVGMAMVRVRMLMLPHDWITQQGHAPNCPFVDPSSTGNGEMSSIVSEGSNQPTEDGKQERTEKRPLDVVECADYKTGKNH